MGNKIKVMLADADKAFCRELMSCLQSKDGFDPVIALRKSQLNALSKSDVLVLDLSFAHENGMDLLRQISHSPLRPITIVTACVVNDSVAEAASMLGAQYFMLKPFSGTKLADRIGDIVSCLQQTDEIAIALSKILREFRIPSHICGYRYLCQAICFAVETGSTSGIYARIAASNGSTVSRVERAIRHAIELAWDNCSAKVRLQFFQDVKPSNLECIAYFAEHLRQSGF